MIHMAYVTAADEDSAPTVLIVDNNPMSTRRLTEVFRVKEFHVVVCEDGDQAVDEYIRLDPELVVIALDIPTLDGHLAALEMREHGGEGRIVFITPRRLADLARDASPLPGMPPLPLPLPVPEALPVADLEVSSEISVPTAEVASEESPKRKGAAKWILLVLVIAGAAYYWSEFGSPI
jgi:CheY-like chemotaxis protein